MTEAASESPSLDETFEFLKPDEKDHKGQRIWQYLQKAVETNNQLGIELFRQFGLSLSQEHAMSLRQSYQFQQMFEKLFPARSKERLQFELQWQHQLTAMLEAERDRANSTSGTAERLQQRGIVVPRT